MRDNGVGFPQEYAGKLFRPFQRLHSQEAFAGNGIGLASVKRIVERHGGTIRAEGAVGEGATLGDKGDPWRATDGTYGVTRSYHPEQQVRVSWHADDDAPTTLVDLKLSPHGDGTQLVLRHKRLPPEADRAALTQRWDDALTRLTQS